MGNPHHVPLLTLIADDIIPLAITLAEGLEEEIVIQHMYSAGISFFLSSLAPKTLFTPYQCCIISMIFYESNKTRTDISSLLA